MLIAPPGQAGASLCTMQGLATALGCCTHTSPNDMVFCRGLMEEGRPEVGLRMPAGGHSGTSFSLLLSPWWEMWQVVMAALMKCDLIL